MEIADVFQLFKQLEDLPNPTICMILAMATIRIMQLVFARSTGDRAQKVEEQRSLYYRKLVQDSLEYENDSLTKQQEAIKGIQVLEDQGLDLTRHIQDTIESDDEESEQSDDFSCTNDSENDKISGFNFRYKRLEEELTRMRDKANRLEMLDKNIRSLFNNLPEKNLDDYDIGLDQEINLLEEKNRQLKQLSLKVTNPGTSLGSKKLNLDTKIDKFIDDYDEDLTCGMLDKILVASVSNEYQTRLDQPTFVARLAQLRVQTKDAEIKFEQASKMLADEQLACCESRIEHILQVSGALKYLQALKEENLFNESIVSYLKHDLNQKVDEIKFWEEKIQQVQDECNKRSAVQNWPDDYNSLMN